MCLFLFSLFLTNSIHVSAKVIFSNEGTQWQENSFILDITDNFDNVDLQFGSDITDKIRFDKIIDKFIIHKNIDLGNFQLENIRVENLSVAPMCDNTKRGKLYYNTTNHSINVCSDVDWVNITNPVAFFPKPIIQSFSPQQANHNITGILTLNGGYFTPNTTVNIVGQTVNSVNFIDDDTIQVDFTSNNIDGLYDIEVINEGGNTILSSAFTIELSTWKDLRQGGDAFTHGNGTGNDIRYRTGMNLLRDANGMYFTGSNPWSSWVKFEDLQWTRGDNKTVEWIMTAPTSSMMIGIGSDATNETNTAQYAQAEVEAYFSSSTNLWGLYGNNGTIGSAGNQNQSTTINSSGIFKLKFEGDGSAGSQFTLYEIPSANMSDWDDESNVITTFTIGGTLNPNEANIMPFIIPRVGSQRFIAIKVQ